ncbi:hypothetical protein HL658_16990 [Azospirillum sp. RWY-5-1]|uniref:Uncharacterized protein n=1 Tax=Azospirillum oleiclasticum TaxID=2735135 RepID=A0ABX2TFD4_9PROT|nr:hypothetical protein [Azospirillum oleiclasticum]NYZ14254.1 hypothetical protein [Azospirillum oleiclasticum]NYZ21739.1 hypothetical protein [Azospirillum oleiclasticum]
MTGVGVAAKRFLGRNALQQPALDPQQHLTARDADIAVAEIPHQMHRPANR